MPANEVPLEVPGSACQWENAGLGGSRPVPSPPGPPLGTESSCAQVCGAAAREPSLTRWLCVPPAGSFKNSKLTASPHLLMGDVKDPACCWRVRSPSGHLCLSPLDGAPSGFSLPFHFLEAAPTASTCSQTQTEVCAAHVKHSYLHVKSQPHMGLP